MLFIEHCSVGLHEHHLPEFDELNCHQEADRNKVCKNEDPSADLLQNKHNEAVSFLFVVFSKVRELSLSFFGLDGACECTNQGQQELKKEGDNNCSIHALFKLRELVLSFSAIHHYLGIMALIDDDPVYPFCVSKATASQQHVVCSKWNLFIMLSNFATTFKLVNGIVRLLTLQPAFQILKLSKIREYSLQRFLRLFSFKISLSVQTFCLYITSSFKI